jgi:UDPglucose 6-dehydrogenase
MSNIAIVGAGHVGVVYAAGLAELGHIVKVVDINEKRVAMLSEGRIWFYEPGLPELLARGLARKRIHFTTSFPVGLARARFVFVCVPTPTTAEGSLDDSYLRSAFAKIREHAPQPHPIIVNKSTVPVGTGDVASRLFEGDDIHVVSNPEFLAEGRAVEDFFHPSRIVIGSRNRIAGEAVASLYAPLRAPIVHTDPVTAEFSKLAANAFLATKVSFANVLSRIGESVGADGDGLAKALSLDPRIGAGHLRAGLGFGGSCLPKDLAAVEQLARRFTDSSGLFTAVAAVNRAQRSRVVDLLHERFGTLADKRIAVLGATFKANTDDLRDSPALALARNLAELHAEVTIYDPVAAAQLRVLRPLIRIARTAAAAARGADATIVATEWPEFATLDLAAMRRSMRGGLLVDARGLFDIESAHRAGFDYFSFSTAGVRPCPVEERLPAVAI